MGIKAIQQKTEERANSKTTKRRELWLKNGDDARVSILTDEKEDENGKVIEDRYFSSFYVHKAKDDHGYDKKYFLCEKREDIPQEYREQRGVVAEQIGFWCYVYFILHETNVIKGIVIEDWKKVKRGNLDRYREEVNDFKIYFGGVGKDRLFESNLVGIDMEFGLPNIINSLRKVKTGDSTVYVLKETPDKTNIPEGKITEAKDLPSVIEYAKEYLVEWGGNKKTTTTEGFDMNGEEIVNDTQDDNESLF